MRKFLCGCDMPSNDALQGDPELKTLAVCSYDYEGFLVCTVHHQRRYGWRSLPEIQTPNGKRADHSFSVLTPWQIEQVVLFGGDKEYLISKNTLGLRIQIPEEDRRDNRDPETIGNSLLQMGSRPSNYPQNGNGQWLESVRPTSSPRSGRSLIQYQRDIAQLPNGTREAKTQ